MGIEELKLEAAAPIPSPSESRALIKLARSSGASIVDHLYALGRVLRRHRCADALAVFAEAANLAPDRVDIKRQLYDLTLPEDPLKAVEIARKIVELCPSNKHQGFLVAAMHRAGLEKRALELCNSCLEKTPNDVDLCATMATVRAAEAPEEALDWIRRVLQIIPDQTWSRSMELGLLWQLGHRAEALRLAGYDQNILVNDSLSTDIDFPKMADELLSLNEPIESKELSTRRGRHTRELSEARCPPTVAQTLSLLRKKLPALVRGRKFSHDTVGSMALQSWAVILQQGGYQDSHCHPSGLVSGVLYIQIPDEPENAGSLELGRPNPALFGELDIDVQIVKPRVGRLILFPSYLFHKTLPTTSSEERISLAFDLCPHEMACSRS